MSFPNPRMSAEQLASKNTSIHLLRSKSPQFDPMNSRLTKEQIINMISTSKKTQEKAKEENTENQDNFEIQTELVVSLRNISDSLKAKSKSPNQTDNSRESVGIPVNSNFRKVNPVRNSFVPIIHPNDKNDIGKPNNDDNGNKTSQNPNGRQGIFNGFSSEMGPKLRSPSVISGEKTTSGFYEANIIKKTVTKNTNGLLDLPLTKSIQPKLTSLVSNNQEIEKEKAQKKPRLSAVVEENTIKRSSSETGANGPRAPRPELFLENPKSLIKLLMSQIPYLPAFESPRVILKQYKMIHSFAVTTHRGTVRNYNEDRVSILLNVQQNLQNGTKVEQGENFSMFSIFDGHGGYGCCNFLKDNLHNRLLENVDLKNSNPPNLLNVYKQTDFQYMRSPNDGNPKFSGSCALTLVIGPKFGMAINVGDSRALASRSNGTVVENISFDHKPEALGEFNRVVKNKGELYRMSINQRTGEERYRFVKEYKELEAINKYEVENPHVMFGPWRVKPGGLSVSRTFGDIESKIESLGGLVGTVVCDPEVTTFNYDNLDFILIGCDGIFDRLSSEQVSETVWETIRFYQQRYNEDESVYEQILGECVNNVLRRAMISRSEDNLTVVLLCFKKLYV